ncbi:glycosyltransferase family 4 protein [soil metagenome]
MRILVGTVDTAGQIPDIADGLRQIGYQVTTAVSERNPFYPHHQYDVEVYKRTIRWSWKVNHLIQLARLPSLIAPHDVFVFLWGGTSLVVNNSEYPLLRALGKRIVSMFCGDDIRHHSSFDQQSAYLVKRKSCVPLKVLRQQGPEMFRNDPLSRPLRNLRIAERWSDLIISQPNQSGLAVRPYMHFFVPLNLSHYKEVIPGRDVPVVVHAPSNKSVKGTDMIFAALERLKSEGVPCEVRLLHGVSSNEVFPELAEADVVVDQLHVPLHGKLGVEAMASGCALADCNREECEPFPPSRPIWHIGPENLYLQLKRLLTDKELRIRLAREGREYVERYHDHVNVARRIVEHLRAGKLKRYDHYPTFFACDYRLPEDVEIPDYLKRMTAQVVQRWGLPEGVDPQDMIARGLMSADGLGFSEPIPRWKPAPSGTTI